MGTSRNLYNAIIDVATELKDAGAVTADGAAQVGGAARVVNVGEGLVQGVLIVDVDALTTAGGAGGPETYDIILQGSTSPTFASDVNELMRIRFSVAEGNLLGRFARAVTNTEQGGTLMPYLRVYHDVGGNAPSISYRAFLTISPLRG